VREIHDDVSAIRLFLEEEDYRELNFFNHQTNKKGDILISEVSDHDDWKEVRNNLIKNTGINTIPHIYVDRIEGDGTLILKHEHDGRDLDIQHGNKVVEHIRHLWETKNVKLYTIVEEEIWEI